MFDPNDYNLSEIADSAEDLLDSFDVGDYDQEFWLTVKDIKELRTCLEFVVFIAEKRERRRSRRKEDGKHV